MTLEQKIAQLFIIRNQNFDETLELVKRGVGGIWQTGMSADARESFRNEMLIFQKNAEIPLFVATDFEEGVGQFIGDDQTTVFPSLMAFGSMPQEQARPLAFQAGKIIAAEAFQLGVNITCAPVFDVNTVPENPISNIRSIGDNPEHVFAVAMSMANGMMESGTLIPLAKHFPGEGMHYMDPHFGLEQMQVTREEMQDIHLLPFRKSIECGIPLIMTNHAIYPCLDPDYPATLSSKIITDLLRKEMKYDGLVITDALEMHGITEMCGPFEAVIRAIEAGNDLILGPINPREAIAHVADAVKDGRISEAQINESIDRIKKQKDKLFHAIKINPPILESLDKRRKVSEEIARKSITLARNTNKYIPLEVSKEHKVLVLEPAHPGNFVEWGLRFNIKGLQEYIIRYADNVETQHYSSSPETDECKEIMQAVDKADIIIISTFFRSKAGQVGLLTQSQVNLLQEVSNKRPTVFVVSNPYVIAELPFAESIVVSYGANASSLAAAADVIFGDAPFNSDLHINLPEYIDPASVVLVAHD